MLRNVLIYNYQDDYNFILGEKVDKMISLY